MLLFKKISMRNFFSFGNVPQVVELDSNTLTLILGQNNDALSTEGAEGARNGVGKSAIIQGLAFGLYGKSIDNSIKIPNLVNKINEKQCEVIIEFEKDGISYRVERGRSPTFFNFYKNDSKIESDESRGEMKDTQEELLTVLGISQTLFEHIVILNTNVQPFLALSTSKQRDMIEELLGITQLTEKAVLLKDMSKESKRLADQEKFKLETITESNKKIQQSISSLEEQAAQFELKKEQKINSIQKNLDDLGVVDFDVLMKEASRQEKIREDNDKIIKLKSNLKDSQLKRDKFNENIQLQRTSLIKQIEVLKELDISKELSLHEDIQAWEQLSIILSEMKNNHALITSKIQNFERLLKNTKDKLQKEMELLNDLEKSQCPMCKQDLEHTDSHKSLLDKCNSNIITIQDEISTYENEINILKNSLPEMFEMPVKPVTFYSTLSDAKLHEHKLETLEKMLLDEQDNPYDSDIDEIQKQLSTLVHIVIPDNEYVDISTIGMLQFQQESLQKSLQEAIESENTYFRQIETLKNDSLQIVDWDDYNRLVSMYEHQDFLLKLLTNKDSHVRKRIIEQNIQFLNKRLSYYIEKSGSNHLVEFMNDLSVDISMNGKSYDYSQLSRGERNRVIISLNLAFRDTYESLYQNINILFVDEIIDNGLDSSGVYNAWSILQDLSATRNKNIYVVSHREELLSKASNILKVLKEDSFSTIEFCTSDDF